MSEAVTPLSLTPVDILSRTEFFGNLTPARLELVSGVSQLQKYEQDCQIYRHGEPAKQFYVLVEGMVKFAVGFGDRNASAGDILRRGSVFGWAALTPGAKHRIATASCVTPCTVLAIDGDGLVELMECDHTLGFQLMTQLNHMITGTLVAFAAG